MNVTSTTDRTVNVAVRLSEMARQMPDSPAVVVQRGRGRQGKCRYDRFTFRQLDDDTDLLADGLRQMGIEPGMRMALLVPPGFDFISLVFALLKAGIVAVLIDPGMGRRNLIKCLSEADPDGFIAIPLAHVVRTLLRRRFPKSRFNVTVGRRWFCGGTTIAQLRARRLSDDFQHAPTSADDPAAIIFTTGSTGPPKGVLYRHVNFDKQVDEIRDHYGIAPGGVDISGFPLFALFNCAMGTTTLIPNMDATRPAKVDPLNIIDAANDWQANQSFGSPALWNTVGRYCEQHNVRLPSLKRVLSAGAPVPVHVLKRVRQTIHDDGDVYTPYGATEAMPVASISAREVLGETAEQSQQGAGTCVGGKFPGIQWKVIRIDDRPIATLDEAEELPTGEIGELIVSGEVVTREYVTRREANALHKIQDRQTFWHRMGDVGYLDGQGRFWFCGRKSHRVLTPDGPMYTIPCESIANADERVYRSALVGVGLPGQQTPVLIVEPWPEHWPRNGRAQEKLVRELRERTAAHQLTKNIRHMFIRRSLPVDIRHNSKIFREKLAVWAADMLRKMDRG